MVQHMENRLPLNSVDTNEQLHEFHKVHAIITQCRKNANNDENINNNHNGYETRDFDNNINQLKNKGSSRGERASFVSTICRTFNALAQATNPSLCAKQNQTSHVTIASTVKNIISQFSRPSYPNSPLCLASPCEVSPTRVTNARHRVTRVQNGMLRKKVNPASTNVNSRQPSQASPSAVNKNVVRVKKIEKEPSPRQQPSPRPFNPTPMGTTLKTKSVRARNANRLTRHVSAPIPHPFDEKVGSKASASVRRSKSDASGYMSFYRRSQRKIDSNVQTKVQHFENCCKDKRRAAMCLECQKHSLEQEGVAQSSRVAPVVQKTDATLPNENNYVGALSYHKPSTITQTSSIQVDPGVTSPSKTTVRGGTLTPGTRPKAVACPGGTFFPSTIVKQPTVTEVKVMNGVVNSEEVTTSLLPNQTSSTDDNHVLSSSVFCGLGECSQMKRKHSLSEGDDMQSKKESRDDGNTETFDLSCNSRAAPDNHETLTTAETLENDSLAPQVDRISPDLRGENMYNALCNIGAENSDNQNESAPSVELVPSPAPETIELDPSELKLPLNDDSSSDSIDSCSSSSESCFSPRQEYLTRHSSMGNLRRTPSSRYQKMRRRLKRLICRPQSYPEALPADYSLNESQCEQEQRYLESIKIPAPNFMMRRGPSSTFSAMRQQLAMHLDCKDWMASLPDHIVSRIFSYMDTKSLAMLKYVCKDFGFIVDTYDIRGTDSLWVKDERYMEDPCKYCRKKFTVGDVSMCRYHAKSYHCDLPYGRSYWMCCFKIERNAAGCRTGIHNNHWGTSPTTKGGK